jgi:serine phosphatase RsbU (regulator of sigma subunit)
MIVHHPPYLPAIEPDLRAWLIRQNQTHVILPGDSQPWDNQRARYAQLCMPIIDAETSALIGCIYLRQTLDPKSIANLRPAARSLAAQIASALHSAKVYARTLEHQKVEQELEFAGRIQASFLPNTQPDIPGWQISASIESARQTSGDFFDIIPLPYNRWGIVIADVADKGTGAALYMALSRTLIRTYALEHPAQPEVTLAAANRRILADTHSDQFVTVFYGVLDPQDGTFTYCNAGHNPAFLLRNHNRASPQPLPITGIPLGLFDDHAWKHNTISLEHGDVLLLYTDGVTEAQDRDGALFGEVRFLQSARTHMHHNAFDLRSAIVADIHNFTAGAPQSDDITLVILQRK